MPGQVGNAKLGGATLQQLVRLVLTQASRTASAKVLRDERVNRLGQQPRTGAPEPGGPKVARGMTGRRGALGKRSQKEPKGRGQ